jgi:hypothetical protein
MCQHCQRRSLLSGETSGVGIHSAELVAQGVTPSHTPHTLSLLFSVCVLKWCSLVLRWQAVSCGDVCGIHKLRVGVVCHQGLHEFVLAVHARVVQRGAALAVACVHVRALEQQRANDGVAVHAAVMQRRQPLRRIPDTKDTRYRSGSVPGLEYQNWWHRNKGERPGYLTWWC